MVVTFKTINKVQFPVYELPSSNWYVTDGLLYLEDKILDDKNMAGETLGQRRIQSPHKNILPIKNQIKNIRGLLKTNCKSFIDSKGMPFIYEKTEFCKLKYYRIKNISKKDTFSLLWLKDVKQPFVIPRPPEDNIQYAGLLHFGELPWILYNYSENKEKPTRRKV